MTNTSFCTNGLFQVDSIFNFQSSIFNFQSSIFNLQFSIFNLQSSIFNLQFSIFNFQFSIFNLLESYDSPYILDGGEGALPCAVGSFASNAVEEFAVGAVFIDALADGCDGFHQV